MKRLFSIALGIATALALTLSPVVYQALEKIQMVLVTIILLFLLVGIFIATKASSWTGIVTQAPAGVAQVAGTRDAHGASAPLSAFCLAFSSSMRARRRTLPIRVLGRSSRNSTARGTL